MKTQLIILTSIICSISISSALECYVCDEQEGNREKCGNTIHVCDSDQDTCLTEVSWGSVPYWSEGAPKQYFISKRCSTKRECEKLRQKNMPDCTYIWYQDWRCSDCCQGDRCNYYIISSASKYSTSLNSLMTTIIVIFLGPWLLK